ncbi:3731_t:CDS:2, partial [Racocetra persica]
MVVRRIEVENHVTCIENEWQNERLEDIVKHASNSNKLTIREMESIDSRDLVDMGHIRRVLYWSHENERMDGTIKGFDMEPGVVMCLTKENCNELNFGNTISIEERNVDRNFDRELVHDYHVTP